MKKSKNIMIRTGWGHVECKLHKSKTFPKNAYMEYEGAFYGMIDFSKYRLNLDKGIKDRVCWYNLEER